MERDISRRTALASAGAALTTSLFTGRMKGANDRITVGFPVLTAPPRRRVPRC